MFDELVNQYYEQCLNLETSHSMAYSEAYTESVENDSTVYYAEYCETNNA